VIFVGDDDAALGGQTRERCGLVCE